MGIGTKEKGNIGKTNKGKRRKKVRMGTAKHAVRDTAGQDTIGSNLQFLVSFVCFFLFWVFFFFPAYYWCQKISNIVPVRMYRRYVLDSCRVHGGTKKRDP